jgi:predicted dehydrogenase
MHNSRRGRVVAVASRSPDHARDFAHRFHITEGYAGYNAMLDDRSVDTVYVALPNSMHHEWTIKALAAGKHVLCEKPFAGNLEQTHEMFDAADRAGRVLAEAFMYLSHPQTHAFMEAIRSGAIGDLRLIRSSFCYRTTRVTDNIRFNAGLAGGALMDVGCYCTSLALLVAGESPSEIHASGRLHPSGVDELCGVVMRFASGVVSTFSCGMTTQADNTAEICGTEGYLEIPVPWKPPARGAMWTIARGTPPRQDALKGAAAVTPPRDARSVDADRDLYALEADDFATTVLDAAPARVPRELTLQNMAVLDEIRRQLGLKY